MKKITDFIVEKRNYILILFIILAGISLYVSTKVNINYDIAKYLPKTSETRIGMDIMEEHFDELKESNLNVMFKGLSDDEKDKIYEELKDLDGVASISYDDSSKYNKDDYTLFVLNVDDVSDSKTSFDLYEEVLSRYEDAYLGGSIVNSNREVLNIWVVFFAIVAAMIILILMCESYVEPFLFLFTIGLGVFLNKGTNIFLPSVSNITSSIAAILQMALSMDYSIMLMNRYSEEREHEKNKVKAMKEALYHAFSAISSSSVTTIVGLLALIFMSFTIGRDLGFVLAKGVLFSLICIFTCLPGLIILFDDWIRKTKKKRVNIRLDFLGRYSYKMRYVMPFIFVLIFVLSFIFKGHLGILYTGSETDEIGKIFQENNQMAIVYNNDYESDIAKYCSSLKDNENIDEVLCYGNTIDEKLKYDELNNRLDDLGVNTKIDEDLLKIIYYYYYNHDANETYSLKEIIDAIDDLKNDKDFKDLVTTDNIDTLKYFATKDNINKLRTKDEIAKILGIDSKVLDELLIYYHSKNENLKLDIVSFVNFMNNVVLKDKTYASMIPSYAKGSLATLTPFTNKDYINKELSTKELSTLFGVDEESIRLLALLANMDNLTTKEMTLKEFVITTDNIKNNTNLLDGYDVSMITSLLKFAKNENNINNTKMPSTMLEQIFGAKLIKAIYANMDPTVTFTPMELTDYVLKNMVGLSKEDVMKLQLMSALMHNDETKYQADKLASLLNQDAKGIIRIYNIADFVAGKSYVLSPFNFVNIIIDNYENPRVSSKIDSDTYNTLILLQNVMVSVNNKTLFTSSSLAKIFGLDRSDMELLYSLYDIKVNKVNLKVSLNDLIKFIRSDVLNNKTYASYIDKDMSSKIDALYNLMNDTLNNKKYHVSEIYQVLKPLSNDLKKDTLELLYIYKGSRDHYDKNYALTIEEIINYLNDDILKDDRFANLIDDELHDKITDATKLVNDAKGLLKGDKYSRMILNTTYELEGDDTFEFIASSKDEFKDKEVYIIGDSPMAYDISKTFDRELNLITIITMVSIFVVVAITFKSLIVPAILVLIIQCAVFFTMGILSIFGGSVYFIAILIVQSILMGATIDYAIVYTSYYKENREKYDIKNSLINAYNSSIHTIISSGAVLVIVTLIVGNFASAIAAKICRTISQGTLCSIMLILLILPALLAINDRFICKGKNKS